MFITTMATYKIAKIYSVDTKNLDDGGAPPRTPLGELTTLPTDPLVGPKRPGFQ